MLAPVHTMTQPRIAREDIEELGVERFTVVVTVKNRVPMSPAGCGDLTPPHGVLGSRVQGGLAHTLETPLLRTVKWGGCKHRCCLIPILKNGKGGRRGRLA